MGIINSDHPNLLDDLSDQGWDSALSQCLRFSVTHTPQREPGKQANMGVAFSILDVHSLIISFSLNELIHVMISNLVDQGWNLDLKSWSLNLTNFLSV